MPPAKIGEGFPVGQETCLMPLRESTFWFRGEEGYL
jgi:hypothetical protein